MKPVIPLLAAVSSLVATAALATATVGQAAPDFALTDLNGKTVKLSDFKGKHVVLEWNNPNCPFVMKHYDSGNMPGLQAKYDARDTVWLTLNSTHPSHQDYMSAGKLKGFLQEMKASPDAYLTDPEGRVGMDYGAKTTPHMYVINPAGTLVYAGAIDDKRSTNVADVKTARNYVVPAVEESKAGKPVTVANTQPYGCSIKYKS